MSNPEPKHDHKYSYADYLTWTDEQRLELIDGVPYDMSPAPRIRHQEILMELATLLHSFLKDKPCKMFVAPVDVRLKNEIHAVDNETYSVVQPDLLVVCDKNKIDDHGILGAPDICIEILSESTAYKDQNDKFLLYQKHGVKEYWIVNPVLETVQIFIHNGKEFEKPRYYRKDDILSSTVLEGLDMKLESVFNE